MSAREFLPPERDDLALLREASSSCRGCALYERATQTVFGRGRPGARLMLVGEQPGDQEDREGEPFVGPAGRLLDRALEQAGVTRAEAYVTNAVKHFKWEPRGKMRLHKKPSASEVTACKPWLLAEIDAVAPEIVVCLGATASQALLGPGFRVTESRGQIVEGILATPVLATVHPSSILRERDAVAREAAFSAFVADLTTICERLCRAS